MHGSRSHVGCSRRRWPPRLAASAVALLAVLVLSACGGGNAGGGHSSEQVTLVVTSYGGTYDEVLTRAAVEPFEASHPQVDVQLAPYAGVAKLAAQGGQGIDVVQLDDFDIIDAAGKGLLRPLAKNERFSYWDDLYQQAFLKDASGQVYGLANVFGSWGIAYNTEHVKEPPTSWKAFWDPRYAGRVAQMEQWIPDMLMAAAAHSGSIDNMEPAWEAFRKLTPAVKQYYGSFSAPEALLKSGEVWLVSWFDGRTLALADEGLPVAFAIPEEGGVLIRSVAGVLKSSKHPEVAEEFINYLMSPEVQKVFAEELYYGPTNRTVELSQGLADKVVYGDEDLSRLIVPDWVRILPQRADWMNRWNEAVRQ